MKDFCNKKVPKDVILQTLLKPKTINHFAVTSDTDTITITDEQAKHKKKDFSLPFLIPAAFW